MTLITLTSDKIKVTFEMLEKANMIRHRQGDKFQIGVPINPANASEGLSWKYGSDLDDSDYEAIESYFILKETKP